MRILLLLSLVAFCLGSTLDSWYLQTSTDVKDSGKMISTVGYQDKSWYPVTVPCTVIACLLQNNVYQDPFFGENLKHIFEVPWWYRTEFNLPSKGSQTAQILFKGLNYRADIWFNGVQIANNTDIAGSFRYFEFDITTLGHWNSANALAVLIYRPHDDVFPPTNNSTDLSITFVDWNPPPADGSMGLWREVELTVAGPIRVQYPMVQTSLVGNVAQLTVMAELSNHGYDVITGVLAVTISEIGTFYQSVTIGAFQTQNIFFYPADYDILNVKNAQLWWPWQMGPSYLHTIVMEFKIKNDISDSLNRTFGIREITSELTSDGFRLYKVNGNPILIRGAGWSPDMFLRTDPQRQEQEFIYMRDMNLNAVRLEGKMENDNFFELADKYGILTLPGWCCCDAWQHWDAWGPEQYLIAGESLVSQGKRLRIFASIAVFMYSSDELPPPQVEQVYLDKFDQVFWPNPIISSAADVNSTITGPSGVKMTGPYSWVPPNYWLLGADLNQLGGAYGFLTEGGPGESPLTLESWERTVSSSDLWPMNDVWDWHCGNPEGEFYDLRYFTPPLYARYGKAISAADYLQKSQAAEYEGLRAMFEGYSRNKYVSTGVIQWMLNNAWPEMIWHLYDYYLNTGGSYFGAKKGCEPVHIQYSYDDNSIWVINSLYQDQSNMLALVEVYDFDANQLYSQEYPIATINADSSVNVTVIPKLSALTTTYFVRLILTNGSSIISRNFYWLSTSQDVLDWSDSNFFRTACSSYADFTMLETLPAVELEYSFKTESFGEGQKTIVSVSNPTGTIALLVRLRLLDANGEDVLPILWEDNYFSLVPNESIEVSATYNSNTPKVSVVLEVYNNISGK